MPYLDHAGARLFYTVDGPDSAPAILFSNSLGTDHTMWEPQAAALAGRFRVVRYDTRGHGRSTAPGDAFTVAQLGQDVIAILDALGIEQAVFCGLSMGGLTGMWLGIHAPQRFSHIVLANTAAKIGNADGWNTRIDTVLREGMAVMVAPSVERWFTPGFAATAERALDGLRDVLAGLDPRGYAANCAAVRDADFRESVASIQVPVLVIAGSQDPSTPAQEGRELADAIPGARFVELPAAHISSFEQPGRFTAALLDFVRGRLPVTDDHARYDAGLAVRREVLGSAHVDRSLARLTPLNEEFQNLITRYAWGEIWTREGLPRHTRSLLTIAMMVALNRPEELRLHLRAAANNGVTRDEIKEVLLQTAIYCGVPAANSAFHLAEEVFAGMDQAG
ncbi:3-oxoadipate enol-lactonase//4-carboxymuconolactone decarboxylase [Cupriavidus necator N-1]|uniref:3-oxoadipate enol-lactonase//4-carboxymuconolactone decarboxylase n=1 Tax=Cupriavidus necator (strain ATCC 43291 / DSM 13513 / CCUG 52238 / LMG 8453 / N-1) TaxID=1042878 RepID=F8GTF9_CUPNN|nr:3-oxoadipate enol-lactonase [Cupriavidus necator]AEI81205.1 3-oxoadipate enol-lactonase//4-carboxymuconolactone decarboxylase [Cupriavidus necator N-1]MDX6009176.1 3-oxoadipate enol-lactonase [Cupriavidus necator]